jgi:hypothetical protein
MTTTTLLPRICRGCGCSDLRACPGGCSWVMLDIETPSGFCSECAEYVEWDQRVMFEWNRGPPPAPAAEPLLVGVG